MSQNKDHSHYYAFVSLSLIGLPIKQDTGQSKLYQYPTQSFIVNMIANRHPIHQYVKRRLDAN